MDVDIPFRSKLVVHDYICAYVVCVYVYASRLTQCSSHNCHTSISMHVSAHTHTYNPAVLCVAGAPWGVPLSCQSRMDEEAALHSKGLRGNTTNMTHTCTQTHAHTLWHRQSQHTNTVGMCSAFNMPKFENGRMNQNVLKQMQRTYKFAFTHTNTHLQDRGLLAASVRNRNSSGVLHRGTSDFDNKGMSRDLHLADSKSTWTVSEMEKKKHISSILSISSVN